MNDLLRRHAALNATLAQFRGHLFHLGKDDCIRLARFHLVKMGHKKLPKIPRYNSPRGAMQALEKLGVENLEQLFDKLLVRIAPAQMLPGDIALVPSEEGAPAWRAGTVVVSLGRKFAGWSAFVDQFATVEPIVAAPFTAAWRA